MPFRFDRPDDALLRALRAAVAAHRPADLRALLALHGERAFATALAGLSGRVIADALSMLATPERAGVRDRLPGSARQRLRELEATQARAHARPAPPSRFLFLFR